MAGVPRQQSTGRRRRRTRSGAQLTRESYVDAALNLIERRGATVLSARSLGAAVGADPTAMYRYFGGIDDVVCAVADRLIGLALDKWTPSARWEDSLADLARRLYDVYANQFPRAGEAIAARTTGLPNEIRGVEAVLDVLAEAGFDDATAARRFYSLADFLLGQAALDAAFDALPPETQLADLTVWQRSYAEADASAYPRIAAAVPHLATMMLDSSFESSLQLMLAGLAASPRCDEPGQH